MVAGSVPFGGTTMMAVLTRHITEPLESPRKRNPLVSEPCAALIEAMMAKDVKDRPASWEDVIRDLGLVMEGQMPVSRRPHTGRSVVTRMTPEELRALRTGSRLAISAQALREAAHTPAAPPARSSAAKPALMTAVVLAVLALVGLTVFLATQNRSPEKAAPVAAPVVVVPVSTPATVAPPVKEADKTEEMWNYAVKYAADHPQQFDVAIGNFRTLKARAAGTKYEMMADVEIRRLEQAQREYQSKAVARVLEDLKTKAQLLADGWDFAGVAALYTAYSGPLAKETEAERTRLAADFTRQAQQLAEAKAKAADAAKQKVNATLTAIVAELLEGKTAEARSRADALAREDLAAERDRVQKVRILLQGLCQADDQILKSFEAQAGQDADVQLAGKVQRLKITGVKTGAVQAERALGLAVVGVTFTLKELPVEERIRRLQGRASPEVCALYAGLAAHARGDDPAAIKTLADAGALAPALQAALAASQQAQKETAARQALVKVLQPLGVTGDDLAWTAVSNRLDKVKWTEAAVTATQNALEGFRKEYGETKFAGAQRGMLDQVNVLLASKANPPATPGVMPDTRGPATPAGTSHYRTAAALKAALIQSNPGYTGDCQVVTEKGRIGEVNLTDAGKCITNIAPLRGLPLHKLKLDVHGSISDFSPLEGMRRGISEANAAAATRA